MKLTLEQPDKCSSCGLTAEEMKEQDTGWFLLGLSLGVGLFCCPACQCAHVNKNVLDNIHNIQQQKIIKPQILLPHNARAT